MYCTACLQAISSFLWLTVFSLNANTYPVGSLLTNSNFPDSQKASKNDFHGPLGQALPLSSCVSLARPVLSGALHFQASDTQAIVITAIILIIVLIPNLLIFFFSFFLVLTQQILACLLHVIRGAPLIIPTVFQLIMPSNIELVIIISMGAFVLLHVVLAFIAGIDTGAEEPKWWEKIARWEFVWFMVHDNK